MFNQFSNWLNTTSLHTIPSSVIAFCFNLYEHENYNWSIELVGIGHYDIEDCEWRCNEITDFGTKENPFTWHQKSEWRTILRETISIIEEYLKSGTYAESLKSRVAIGVGFVDGDVSNIYPPILKERKMKYFWTAEERQLLHTTCCFEFQKGTYKNRHWLDDSLCLNADIFDEFELYKIFSKAIPNFDYYGPTEVTQEQWRTVIELAHSIAGTQEEIILEVAPWVEQCFEEEKVFTICGI